MKISVICGVTVLGHMTVFVTVLPSTLLIAYKKQPP